MMQSIRLTNSGEKRLRTATRAIFCSLLVIGPWLSSLNGLKSEIGIDFAHHFPCAEVAGEKDQALFEIDGGVVTETQNAFVQNAQKQPRHGRGGFFNLIEKDQGKAAFFTSDSVQFLLRQHGLRFPMAQVSRR